MLPRSRASSGSRSGLPRSIPGSRAASAPTARGCSSRTGRRGVAGAQAVGDGEAAGRAWARRVPDRHRVALDDLAAVEHGQPAGAKRDLELPRHAAERRRALGDPADRPLPASVATTPSQPGTRRTTSTALSGEPNWVRVVSWASGVRPARRAGSVGCFTIATSAPEPGRDRGRARARDALSLVVAPAPRPTGVNPTVVGASPRLRTRAGSGRSRSRSPAGSTGISTARSDQQRRPRPHSAGGCLASLAHVTNGSAASP